jgi:hypothetical protein
MRLVQVADIQDEMIEAARSLHLSI